ncbi:MAG: HAMP domain-containing histidine kinase [Candidatus Aminicenantes bacterium]|nr:HAMP domain-containing histidine kinase [Candidatus Aminicenantes bacterium]
MSQTVPDNKEILARSNPTTETAVGINRLIYKFLHPFYKFVGSSKLISQIGKLLQGTIQPDIPDTSDSRALAEMLIDKITIFRDNLPDRGSDQLESSRVKDLKKQLTKIINMLSHSLNTETNPVLLAVKTRDTAIWVLEEVMKIDSAFGNGQDSIVGNDLIQFIQGILFFHLLHGARTLSSEIRILERELEALRTHMGLEKERRYPFARGNIGEILEANLELFAPAFSEKKIEVNYKPRGNLNAEISRNDIDRMICILLRNAVEYSYRGEGRFVKVKAREMQPKNEIEISIENFGIPIKKEEIDSGAIWKFGYRGEFAYENYRDGIGAGLADAKEVVDAHKGKIAIISMPRGNDGNPPRYKVPYLTTVTVRIPRKRS